MTSLQSLPASGPFWRKATTRRSVAALAIGALLVTTATAPVAQAKPAGAFFEKVAAVLEKAGVDRDSIEMARYTVNQTRHAGIVFNHAAAQDYPFFALVGSVKAVKEKDLPGIGTFTQTKCETPVTLIDGVFGQADAFVDNAKGKQDTQALVAGARQFAADHAKATSAQAKAEVQNQLAETIPYFGEIKTICSFAFETDFSIEKNFQQTASKTSQNIHKIYRSFRDGEYATGVSTALTLGVSSNVACGLVDTLVDESLIGRTPLLGDLARSACSGFAGKVIDGFTGIIKGGVGLIEDGVSYAWDGAKAGACKLYSLVGSGCSKAPPPDPLSLAVGGAQNWCAARGGLKTGNFPNANNFLFDCNDGSVCRRKEGGATLCATAEEKAANEAQRRATLEADLALTGGRLAEWQKQFVAMWQPLCVDGDNQCRNAISGASGSVRGTARALVQNSSGVGNYFAATDAARVKAETQALAAVEEARFRLNPARWATRVDKIAATHCLDAPCKAEMETLKTTIVQTVAGQHKMKPQAPYASMAPVLLSGDAAVRSYVTASLARAGKRPVSPAVAPAPAGPIKLPAVLPPVSVPPGGRPLRGG